MTRPMFMILLLAAYSCSNPSPVKTEQAPGKAAPDTATIAKAPYFPVRSYLLSEIASVDSLPVGIMKYSTSENGRKDSGYIKPAEFHKLAAEFTPDEIREPAFTNGFNEASFMDKSNGSGTFFYSPKTNKSEVKRIDVLSSKGDVYDNVKSIYIEKMNSSGDSMIIRKLYWKPGRFFQTITQIATGHAKPSTSLVKVVWDNRE